MAWMTRLVGVLARARRGVLLLGLAGAVGLGPWPFCHTPAPRIAYFCPRSIAIGESALTRVMVFHRGSDVSGFRWTAGWDAGPIVSFSDERADFFENAFGAQEARVQVTGLAPGSIRIEVAQPPDRAPIDYRFNEGRGPCTVTVAAPPTE